MQSLNFGGACISGWERMALFDISLPPSIAKALHLPGKSPERQQIKVLKKLLKKGTIH